MPRQRKKNRLPGFDYSTQGAYFITTCVHDRRCVFGTIENGGMCQNTAGGIIRQQWEWLHEQYAYLTLDAYVVMPNHFHAVLMVGTGRDLSLQNCDRPLQCDHPGSAGTCRDLSLQKKIKSVPELIGAFKTTSSKLIHQSGNAEFQWQRSYYDHIIRTSRTLDKIRRYIQNNPMQWEQDVEYAARDGRDNETNHNLVGTGRDLSLQKESYYRHLFQEND